MEHAPTRVWASRAPPDGHSTDPRGMLDAGRTLRPPVPTWGGYWVPRDVLCFPLGSAGGSRSNAERVRNDPTELRMSPIHLAGSQVRPKSPEEISDGDVPGTAGSRRPAPVSGAGACSHVLPGLF